MEISYYILIFTFLYLLKNHFLRKFKNLTPSPFISLPIIDHLYLLKKKPLHKTLANISEKHGPLLYLRFGSLPVLLALPLLLKRNVSPKTTLLAGKHYLGFNYTTLSWASYGQHWHYLRRISTLEILSTLRVQMCCSYPYRWGSRSAPTGGGDPNTNMVDMKVTFFEMTVNILMMMIAGKQYYGGSAERLEV